MNNIIELMDRGYANIMHQAYIVEKEIWVKKYDKNRDH